MKEQAPLFVCADVGGTFTDCIVVQAGNANPGPEATPDLRSIKVLSTGLIRCEGTLGPDDNATLTLPDELLCGLPGHRLPDRFFAGAKLSELVSGIRHSIGTIREYHAASGQVSIQPAKEADAVDGDHLRQFEIDCGLEAPVLATRLLLGIPIEQRLPPMVARVGTTKGTNALLTRTGANTALVINEGFGDVLLIGEQDREELFDLSFNKPVPLAENVIEVRGRLDAAGNVLAELNEDEIRKALHLMRRRGVEAIAICLMHSYVNDSQEQRIETIAREVGFRHVSRSSEVAPLIKLVSRAETTTLDAYLNPILSDYVRRVATQFGRSTCELQMMTSGGNLVAADQFRGRDSVLSGPAGGVVGLQFVSQSNHLDLAIGLDMGGTSTDVSRFDGQVGRRYVSKVAGVRVMTSMMDIHTVAAGGGSICDFIGGRLEVGPASAGASPGPACYGSGGPLTVTDINLLLGRLSIERFPFPLSIDASQERLEHVAGKMPNTGQSVEALAEGFLDIAVTHMAEAVRAITTARGVPLEDHALVGFGGAAAQHLCRVAESLGIQTILDHPFGSVLSAVGIGVAPQGTIETVGLYENVDQVDATQVAATAHTLAKGNAETLQRSVDEVTHHYEADLRYAGTDATIPLSIDGFGESDCKGLIERFHQQHRARYGYDRHDRAVQWVSLRCESQTSEDGLRKHFATTAARVNGNAAKQHTQVYHRGEWQEFRLIDRERLLPGDKIDPKTVIVSDQTTLIVEPDWQGEVTADGSVRLNWSPIKKADTESSTSEMVQMEIAARRLQSIADSMGEVLRRTAISVNVKERLDFSCAIFRGDGTLIANAPHVPVHLGAMGHTVKHLAATFPDMADGDCYVSNDPYAGGSHLPDVTLVSPVYCDEQTRRGKPDFFVASRAHHAEIGGLTPGSMPPNAKNLAQEGVLIRAFALVKNGESFENELAELLGSGTYPSRNVGENIADLRAQIAAGQEGARLLKQMTTEIGAGRLERLVERLLDVAEDAVIAWIKKLPEDELHFEDTLDDGTKIAVTLRREASQLVIDFTGTAGVHPGAFNATRSIVNSVVLYVMRCFCESNLPLCDGALRPIELIIPPGLLDPPSNPDPAKCPAVVAGNVETSMRIVDVLLGAIGSTRSDAPVFRAVAASQGTMNNVLFGDERFGYYETIGGGAGASVFGPGADGVHTHMTNTRITDAEVLESRLPIRLREFSIRRGSGGLGKQRGGDGLVREFEFLKPLTVSLITNRRTTQPYGVFGGADGVSGRNLLIQGDTATELASSVTIDVQTGDRLRIETPGGGGWGQA
ncbi:hydantoinase B/oxoprolinase family protein [Rhodopirellula sp. MGV]|uniref:hydantoinase B/oxoprolinase family protein n=1 Tax=Rhodopirellula sp. MGV TaxID=2023130 RepID=UPI000B97A6BF|nr:hydantoinase B/oxoprolinase family protein [Rhodopirellula sp. MGV]OYP37641.1 5-oxoprolinase [Rhodopirellula sp. MGV]PNY34949.1 5-oxoprolinase [Rhodopirellula baltica]